MDAAAATADALGGCTGALRAHGEGLIGVLNAASQPSDAQRRIPFYAVADGRARSGKCPTVHNDAQRGLSSRLATS